jgi:hypothetical protein
LGEILVRGRVRNGIRNLEILVEVKNIDKSLGLESGLELGLGFRVRVRAWG